MNKDLQYEVIEPSIEGIEKYIRKNPRKTLKSSEIDLLRAIRLMKTIPEIAERSDRHIFDSEKHVIAIKCAASERWCPREGPKAVEFGTNPKNAITGLNRMSKKAFALYYKELRRYQKTIEGLNNDLIEGLISEKDAEKIKEQAQLRRENLFIDWPEGFATKQECIFYLQQNNLYT